MILLASFDSTPHPPDNMDFSIDPIERSHFDSHFNGLVDYIDKPIQTPLNFGFLMKIHLKPNILTLCTSHDPVCVHTIFPHTMEVHFDVSQPHEIMERNSFMTDVYPVTRDYHLVEPLENNLIND